MNGNDQNDEGIPFTARLMAYYRAQESKKNDPLFTDPFAESLAGDFTLYFKKDGSFKINNYPLIRTYYIDKQLLIPWCEKRKSSQVVILGAGLDTRAYRISHLQLGEHIVYEIDFLGINHYKEGILENEHPLCQLIRVSADLLNSNWVSQLRGSGFSTDISSLWILEGLAYYMEKENFEILLSQISKISLKNCQLFVDVCNPVCSEVDFGPFFRHFKWGLNKEEILPFFNKLGWKVSYYNAEDFAQDRFVGTNLMFFVHGKVLNFE